MILALRCPTGAPNGLASMFQNAAAVYDTLRAADEKLETDNSEVRGQSFHFYTMVTETLHRVSRSHTVLNAPVNLSTTLLCLRDWSLRTRSVDCL